MKNNSKIVVGANSAAVSTLTASFDTLGFSFAKILVLSVSTGTLSTGTVNKIEEGDTTSAYATFAGVVSGTDWTPSTNTNSTAVAKMQYNIDLRGRKRYLKVTMEHATTAAGSIIADLSIPSDGISDSASAGAANSVGI
jgi:hypothetical protein